MAGKETLLEVKKTKQNEKVLFISGFALRNEVQELLMIGA